MSPITLGEEEPAPTILGDEDPVNPTTRGDDPAAPTTLGEADPLAPISLGEEEPVNPTPLGEADPPAPTTLGEGGLAGLTSCLTNSSLKSIKLTTLTGLCAAVMTGVTVAFVDMPERAARSRSKNSSLEYILSSSSSEDWSESHLNFRSSVA